MDTAKYQDWWFYNDEIVKVSDLRRDSFRIEPAFGWVEIWIGVEEDEGFRIDNKLQLHPPTVTMEQLLEERCTPSS